MSYDYEVFNKDKINTDFISQTSNNTVCPQTNSSLVQIQKSLKHPINSNKMDFNCLRIFGIRNIFNIWEFLQFCRIKKIPCIKSYIHEFKLIGYKSENFDSRSFQIILTSKLAAFNISTELTVLKIRHTCCYVNNENCISNNFKTSNKFKTINDFLDISQSVNFKEFLEPANNQKINICTWNIQSIKFKTKEIITFMTRNNIHLIGLTETRWNGDELCLPSDFIWYGKRSNKKCGGVGFIIHKSVICNKNYELVQSKTENTLFFLLNCKNKKRSTLFGLAYGPASASSSTSQTWWDSLTEDIYHINTKISRDFDTILMGDFNSRIGTPKSELENNILGKYGEKTRNTSGKNAINFMIRNNFICLNNRTNFKNSTNYTYHQQGKIENKSIIDLILVNKEMMRNDYHTKVIQTTLTGHESHFPVVTKIKFIRNIPKEKVLFTRSFWNLNRLKEYNMQNKFIFERDHRIKRFLASDLQNTSDINCKFFTQILNDSAKSSIGKFQKTFLSKNGFKQRIKKSELKNILLEYKKLLRAATKNEVIGKNNFNDKLRFLRKKIDNCKSSERTKKLEKIIDKVNSAIDKDDFKNVYKNANEFVEGKKHQSINALRDKNGKVHCESKKILEILRDSWKDCFKKRNKNRECRVKSNKVKGHKFFSECNSLFTFKEIKESISSLKANKAQGIDDIPSEFFSDQSETLVKGLQKLFNLILKSRVFPTNWKIDKRTPIFKKGDKLCPENYRPIAVHSVLRKIFCKILYDRLLSMVNIHPNQYGFIKEKRCSDHASVVRDLITTFKNNKNCGELYIAVFDFEKAFDSCDPELLIDKLEENGISGLVLDIVKSIYKDCKAKVYFNGKYSTEFNIECGVAQGCKLSTVLFNIYINDLLERISPSTVKNNKANIMKKIEESIALCYADDLIIISSNKKGLERSINILESWCFKNYIKVSAKKSQIMIINKKDIDTVFYVNKSILKEVNTIKYLGFTITNDGSWDQHIEKCIGKVHGLIYKWKDLLKSNKIQYKYRILLADAMILSHLSYGEEIITPSRKYLNRIQSVETRILKTIFNLPRQTNTNALLHLTGRLSTYSRLKLRRLTNFCRINRLNLEVLNSLFNENIIKKTKNTLVNQTLTDIKTILEKKNLRTVSKRIPSEIITSKEVNISECKNYLKRYIRLENSENIYRSLQVNNNDIATINSRVPDETILSQKEFNLKNLVSWRLGITGLSKNYHLDEDSICPLCDTDYVYNFQKHLLSHCSATIHHVYNYMEKIKSISEEYYKRYCKTPSDLKWIYILRSGEYFFKKSVKTTYPIREGESISFKVNKENVSHKRKAIKRFNEIKNKVCTNSIVIYTDGSIIKDNQAGAGAVIYFNDEEIGRISFSLEETEINFTEIFSIYKALEYVRAKKSNLKTRKINRTIHVFTDSQNTIKLLTMTYHAGKYSMIVNRILDSLSSLNGPNLELHWVPSHVSYRNENFQKITIEGNDIADTLAKSGAESRENVLNVRNEFVHVPKIMTKMSANLVSKIDKMLQNSIVENEHKCSQNYGPSSDDFSSADALQFTQECPVTS